MGRPVSPGASAEAACYSVPVAISGQESVQLRLSALRPARMLSIITEMPPAPSGMLSLGSPKVGCLSISSCLLTRPQRGAKEKL